MLNRDRGYMSGFANHFATEALPGALPTGQNSPQKAAYGLVAEQLSGSAFTERRKDNYRSWLYRILPSVLAGRFEKIDKGLWRSGPMNEVIAPPTQLRWDPLGWPSEPKDFLEGIVTIAGNGDVHAREGNAIHIYCANRSMKTKYFYNSDGDMLIVPQEGTLEIATEFGFLEVAPCEIAVIQRGIKFQVRLKDNQKVRGYICENYGAHFELPNLGPIGANGLANPRDFLVPQANYEDCKGDFTLVTKFLGELWQASINHSPLDVVAWHGNYAPYKYDLRLFNTVNTVSYDHPDPSIFTVLTSQTGREGVANCDFVIFPPRWMVADKTFRPPYFHRNVMSEYMGLIHGIYDAKPAGGFEPGGGSLHNCMQAHGPEAKAYLDAMEAQLKPVYQGNTLAFMFESAYAYRPTRYAMEGSFLQKDYQKCWQDIPRLFHPDQK